MLFLLALSVIVLIVLSLLSWFAMEKYMIDIRSTLYRIQNNQQVTTVYTDLDSYLEGEA